jgi:hypothetical protein
MLAGEKKGLEWDWTHIERTKYEIKPRCWILGGTLLFMT